MIAGKYAKSIFLCALTWNLLGAGNVKAQNEPFYQGKTVRIVVGLTPGGFYDRWARLLARFMPLYMPGNPNFIVQNMAGAGSMIAMNHVFGVAKPDDVDLDIESQDLGQGHTETRYRYLFTDNGRSVLAEEVKSEIFDGATASSRYLRGVLIDGGRGTLVTASRDGAVLTEG